MHRITYESGIATVAECDSLCHAYSGCVEFAVGSAGGNYVGRCDLFKAGCPSY